MEAGKTRAIPFYSPRYVHYCITLSGFQVTSGCHGYIQVKVPGGSGIDLNNKHTLSTVQQFLNEIEVCGTKTRKGPDLQEETAAL